MAKSYKYDLSTPVMSAKNKPMKMALDRDGKKKRDMTFSDVILTVLQNADPKETTPADKRDMFKIIVKVGASDKVVLTAKETAQIVDVAESMITALELGRLEEFFDAGEEVKKTDSNK